MARVGAVLSLSCLLALLPSWAHAQVPPPLPPPTLDPLPPAPAPAPALDPLPPVPVRVAPAPIAPPHLRLTPPVVAPPPAKGRGVWRSFRAGADLVGSVPTAAIIDGGWSISLHVNTELTNRTWDAPYPAGTIGQYSTRILYGFSWTLMLGFESLAVVLASKGKFDWLGEAAYRSDWIVPIDLPACPRPGAYGGCGLGVGGFAYIQIRPRGKKWWYEAGGGWFQQRVLNDALRTVAESTWVLTPISAIREIKSDPDADVAYRLFAGPGIYFGMHAGHMHPTPRGEEVYPNVPWSEMYPLDAGIGPGGRVEGRLIIKQHLSLEADFVMAPFLFGGPAKRVSSDIAPLDFEREGMSVWRKVSAGIGWDDPTVMPFKASVGAFAAELSERPIDRIGYRGVMLRFDIPLRVPRDD